jgi:hypothetical protein
MKSNEGNTIQDLLSALQELVDLIDDCADGYVPDSFTCQPARAAIRKAISARRVDLTTTRVNGADYSVPAPVAGEIILLRGENLALVKGRDELRAKLRNCETELVEEALVFIDGLRDDLAITTKLGAAGWNEFHKCQEALNHLRSDSQPRADIAEMIDFLDELHQGLNHNMYEATPLLRCAFPELSQRDATIVLMTWLWSWNERHGEET